jgi:hypothetical protein
LPGFFFAYSTNSFIELYGALFVATMMCGTCRISATALKSFSELNFALG